VNELNRQLSKQDDHYSELMARGWVPTISTEGNMFWRPPGQPESVQYPEWRAVQLAGITPYKEDGEQHWLTHADEVEKAQVFDEGIHTKLIALNWHSVWRGAYRLYSKAGYSRKYQQWEAAELEGLVTSGPESEPEELINHPGYYGGDTTYEAIKIIEAWNMGFSTGNALKYLIRAPYKAHELQDLRKAVWYIERRISQLTGEYADTERQAD
jgi:hypothetical protein